MVERGARHLIFLSRSAGTSNQAGTFFQGLRIQTCSVQACRSSVTDIDEVGGATNNAAALNAGVMHMSMLLMVRTHPTARKVSDNTRIEVFSNVHMMNGTRQWLSR